jgi:2,3-dihydroxyphenylpropionate 1,2-dioxygenase
MADPAITEEFHRAYRGMGEELAAADVLPERIAVVGTGGISHWPATPDSGKINEEWDRELLRRHYGRRRQNRVAYDLGM